MRLTGKNGNKYGFITENNTLSVFVDGSIADKCYTKLGQLEDIEEELGIDLLTLFKALKNGVYVKETQYSRHTDYVDGAGLGFGHNGFYCYDVKNRFWDYVKLKDYDKTLGFKYRRI